MPVYYSTPVSAVDSPGIRSIFDELLHISNYQQGEQYDLPIWKWFGWFFMEKNPRSFKQACFMPGSPLSTRICKLSDRTVFEFCREIAQEKRLYFESFENVTVMTLLKKAYKQ